MPWGLKRFHESRQLHFLTFSCYKRRPKFRTPKSRNTFESALERARQQYGLCVYAYVVMPEHVHLLINEPSVGRSRKRCNPSSRASRENWPYELRTRSGRLGITISTCGASASSWKS